MTILTNISRDSPFPGWMPMTPLLRSLIFDVKKAAFWGITAEIRQEPFSNFY
jgi:hypothetical protein